ncbi:hypothetical protein AB0M12_05575 [Nocardia vinacea]|uniref:hypothetical protein n=1 Tax=Nocardia vinacea TaxID=96468 RepID=UPI0034349937
MSERLWRTGLSAGEGTPRENIRLAPTFEQDMADGLRIYRSTLAGNPPRAATAHRGPGLVRFAARGSLVR